jgi:hypothetical protein
LAPLVISELVEDRSKQLRFIRIASDTLAAINEVSTLTSFSASTENETKNGEYTSGSKPGTQFAHTSGRDRDLVWVLHDATD